MNNYILTIVQNGTACASYMFSTVDDALVMFHNELAYRAEGRNSTLCIILDMRGGTIKKEYWERPYIPSDADETPVEE